MLPTFSDFGNFFWIGLHELFSFGGVTSPNLSKWRSVYQVRSLFIRREGPDLKLVKVKRNPYIAFSHPSLWDSRSSPWDPELRPYETQLYSEIDLKCFQAYGFGLGICLT